MCIYVYLSIYVIDLPVSNLRRSLCISEISQGSINTACKYAVILPLTACSFHTSQNLVV